MPEATAKEKSARAASHSYQSNTEENEPENIFCSQNGQKVEIFKGVQSHLYQPRFVYRAKNGAKETCHYEKRAEQATS